MSYSNPIRLKITSSLFKSIYYGLRRIISIGLSTFVLERKFKNDFVLYNKLAGEKKALKEKLDNGNPGHRKLKVLDAPDVESTDIEEAVDMPPVKE